MKTKLHYYYFSLATPEGAAAWKELQAKLLAEGFGPRRMHSHGGTEAATKNETIEVEIEPECLFDNQWNAAAPHNMRVFDWFQQYEINRVNCARGHWLEITPEMQQAREQTFKCGYCGHHYGPLHAEMPPADGFCKACLDSPYLEETNFALLKLAPLSERDPVRTITAAEVAALLPRYVERQTTGSDSRAAQRREKQRLDIETEFQKDTATAQTEHDGKLWLWERKLDLENVIFYSHTGKFSFGWRSPVAAAVADKLETILKDFPFSYEIKSVSSQNPG